MSDARENGAAVVMHYTGYDHERGGIMVAIGNLARAGRFHCVLGVKPGFAARRESHLDFLEWPAIDGEKIDLVNCWRARRVALAVREWLRADPRRVFHGHSRAGLLVGLWLRWLGESRVVVSVHCYGRQRWFYRWAARRMAGQLYWLTPAMKRHYGVDATNWTRCMPNGVPGLAFAGKPTPPARGTLRIGGAGALVRWKRWDLVLRALARLPAEAKVEFFHIGGAIDSDESRECGRALHALARSAGVAARVHWLGWQNASAALLASVDVVVVASDGEPFSMIALEALLAGKPVIATRGGGPEDIIVDGRNGWLVAADDEAALADRFEQCLRAETWAGLEFEAEHVARFSARVAEEWARIYANL